MMEFLGSSVLTNVLLAGLLFFISGPYLWRW